MTKLLIVFLFLVVSSCDFFLATPKVNFIVENKSSKDLEIRIYGESKLLNYVKIKSMTNYDTLVVITGSNSRVTPFNEQSADSLVIAFSDGKIIRQYCDGVLLWNTYPITNCRSNKNLLDFNTGTATKKKLKDEYTKTMTYDETDYAMAIDP